MTIRLNERSFFVFDLDDTLFAEIDFLRSAYRQIARELSLHTGEDLYEEMITRYQRKENVFGWIISNYGTVVPDLTKERLLEGYRSHAPEIYLSKDTRKFLDDLRARNIRMGIITDGRSVTQRNKLNALGITDFFCDIIISEEFGSEKPAPANYLFFQDKYPNSDFYFVGDNTGKDFIMPVQLGWTSICIKDAGQNIHRQNFDLLPKAIYLVNSYKEIELI